MRIFLTIMLVALSAFSFSQEETIELAPVPVKEEPQTAKVSVPQNNLVWTAIEQPIVITPQNAKNFMTYEGIYERTPESVVNYFFASQIRKDKLWEKVVMSQYWRGDLLQAQLDQYEKVTIVKFNLVSKTATVPNQRFWVRVDMEIKVGEKVKEVTGESDVIVLGGDWFILSLPVLDLISK
ncbi:hypothetical protein [Fluviicola chungangensis]|uniref:Uncharacterized protein n=1 Tax=Fluviicola chungangensis TaxID=2597671 RepID=A0A556MGL0_9FLAO|nr:hypothetical protein [Fluviicola chungangensis]TSJ38972.1 hypothetical protein FO442_18320 [Fluviicola chungangensis]